MDKSQLERRLIDFDMVLLHHKQYEAIEVFFEQQFILILTSSKYNLSRSDPFNKDDAYSFSRGAGI
jgi:hypothetical protein